MRDAMLSGLESLRSRKEEERSMIKELVVLTDGEDNDSKVDLDSLIEELSKPGCSHFHLIMIAIAEGGSNPRDLQVGAKISFALVFFAPKHTLDHLSPQSIHKAIPKHTKLISGRGELSLLPFSPSVR